MTRLVLKLLLKCMIPLALLVGTLSYGVYLRGGDPFSIVRSVGGGLIGNLGGQVAALGDSASDGVARAGAVLGGDDSASGATPSDRVFTWKDADGVTHFATEAPVDGRAQAIYVDPDVNVLTPVRAPASPSTARLPDAAAARPRASGDEPAALPGIAGHLDTDASAVSPEQAARLLKMLQGGGTR